MKPFSFYMNEWLYGQNGYYASMPKIGKDGDFYTSVSTSMFFGGSIANHLLQTIDSKLLSKSTLVVEIGAHRGYLLADIIQFIYTLRPKLLNTLKFAVVEPLEKIEIEQKKYFKSSFGDGVDIKIVKSIKEISYKEAFIVSNELFDSFVCEVIKDEKMLYMDLHEPIFKPINTKIENLSKKYNISKGEIPLGVDEFASKISNSFEKFKFISFDYGDKNPRNDISLRVYSKHEVYPFFELTKFVNDKNQLLSFFAKSDITYDVCFSILQNSFKQVGGELDRYCTQMVALNEFGIIDLLTILYKNSDEQTYKHELEKVKQLILPNFLGERFKMISFIKD